jgi:Uma2 family endonuclease
MPIVQPRLTSADLQDLPDDGKRYELLEGELVVSPAPTRKHQKATGRVYTFLLRAEDAGYGEAYVAPFEVYFDEHNDAQPDALCIRQDRLAIVKEARVEGVPDLVVEVLSPSTRRRDLRVKMQIYARFGVSFYWLIDAVAGTVLVHTLTPQGYVAGLPLQGSDTLDCPLFPDLTTTIDELLR